VDLERINQQPVTRLDRVGTALLQPESGRIEKHPVRAVGVNDEELAVHVPDRGVVTRDVLIRQDPIVAVDTSNGAAFNGEDLAAALAQSPRLRTDHFEFQQHFGPKVRWSARPASPPVFFESADLYLTPPV
jgi:hypothetical protein